MFGKLKEKLKGWITKTAQSEEKKEEQLPEEKPLKEPKEETSEKKKTPSPKKETLPQKEKSDLAEDESKELPKPEPLPEPPFEKKEFTENEIKEIPLPTKFEVGTQKVEPDLERIKELEREVERAIKKVEEKETLAKPKVAQGNTEKKGFFKNLGAKLAKVKITQKEFDIYAEELELLLVENNVAYEVAEKIIKKLAEEIVDKEFLKKEIEGQIKEALKDIIAEILVEPFDLVQKAKEKEKKPFVILFCGINGTGKTTSIAKIANKCKEAKLSCVLAAADTFRAASIEQIKEHAEKLGIKLIAHDYGADPAAVGFDAIKYATKNHIDVVLIDTAGRMHSEKNLLKELEKINRVTKPDCKIFVGEAITGNDAVEQVKSFSWAIGIDGIILTKADTDEKGGTALSLGYTTKKPILYLGTGQTYKDLTPFSKQKFIDELGL